MKNRTPFLALAATALLALTSPVHAAGPVNPNLSGSWVTCTDSGIDDGASLYYGSVTCGGDPTPTSGGVGNIDMGTGMDMVAVGITGANPFNFYEVYWLPVGQPITSAVKLGGFLTDCNGNTPNPVRPSLLREITSATDGRSGTVVDFSTTVGATAGAGVFLAYSRGPFSYDDPVTTCPWPTTFNTVNSMYDTDATAPLANPAVDLSVDSIQYISGFSH